MQRWIGNWTRLHIAWKVALGLAVIWLVSTALIFATSAAGEPLPTPLRLLRLLVSLAAYGFIIFTASSFGGTFYLGLLTSITLVVAMFNNLLLLPSMLLSLERWSNRKNFKDVTPADTLAEAEVGIEDIGEQVSSNGSPLKHQ